MASFEIEEETHEITLSIKLTDDSPIMQDAYGLEFKPIRLLIQWAKENAGAWEVVRAELIGKRVTMDNKVGTHSVRKTYWGTKHAPEWVREILTDSRPVEVMRASHS